MTVLDATDRRLLDEFQRDLPITARPYREMAARLGVTEGEAIARLQQLKTRGCVSRVGPVLAPRRLGASTLAALRVPPERLDAVAALVSGYDEVNHNYAREHDYNLWFVVTASSPGRVRGVLDDIELRTGLVPLDLPLEQAYHIDLGFPLWPA